MIDVTGVKRYMQRALVLLRNSGWERDSFDPYEKAFVIGSFCRNTPLLDCCAGLDKAQLAYEAELIHIQRIARLEEQLMRMT